MPVAAGLLAGAGLSAGLGSVPAPTVGESDGVLSAGVVSDDAGEDDGGLDGV